MFKYSPSPFKSSYIILLLTALLMILLSMFIPSNTTILLSYSIMNINNVHFMINLIMDMYSIMFSAIVLFISSNVMLFSMFYMKEEMYKKRFTYLTMLFILSMNLLIFTPNLVTLLLGWDGLGLVSFLLVIYYNNNKSLSAGMLTALTNRLGDVLIIFSICLMFSQSHWSIMQMWNNSLFMQKLFIIMLILAFCTKSAQIPFSSWLPAAMAAPTPISALVHSSTLVTAGVYLMLRFYPFFQTYKMFNTILMIMSISTMMMAGMAALVENDMKKIIALSTLSQLGVMMFSISLGMINLAYFHMITHALFKALLFICAGILINFHSHGQDLRMMGNLYMKIPLTCAAAVIANMALCGAPFLAGFFSKDLIIETMFTISYNLTGMVFMMLATMLTTSYSFRFLIILFSQQNLSEPFFNIKEMKSTVLPLLFLSSLAIMGGAILSWLIITPYNEPIIPMCIKSVTPIIIISGVVLSIPFSFSSSLPLLISPKIHSFMSSMWGLTPMSTKPMIIPIYKFSHYQLKMIDQGWLEMFGPSGLMKNFMNIPKIITPPQNIPLSHMLTLTLISPLLLMLPY